MIPLERAAEVLEREIGSHCSNCEAQFSYGPRDLARAVLQAIREPSETMSSAAMRRWASMGDLDDAYRAMIDAALEEG